MSKKNDVKEMSLSNQALGAIMMALQNAMLEGVDITDTLKGFVFVIDEDANELIVTNPPVISFEEED